MPETRYSESFGHFDDIDKFGTVRYNCKEFEIFEIVRTIKHLHKSLVCDNRRRCLKLLAIFKNCIVKGKNKMEKQKPVKELELYLIRHAESAGNVPRDCDNISLKDLHDPVLTEKGEFQAKRLGEYLKNIGFDKIYSSALRRTVRTATEIIKKQPQEYKLEILPYITEAGISSEYVTDFDTIHAINPDAVIAEGYGADLPLLCYTDSTKEQAKLLQQGKKAFEYVRSRYTNGEKVAFVCHAAIMTYICFIAMGFQDAVPAFDLNFKNTAVTKIIFYKKGTNPYGDTVFDYINSTAHLELG